MINFLCLNKNTFKISAISTLLTVLVFNPSFATASNILLQADFNDLETPDTDNPRQRFSTIEGEGTPLGDSGFSIISGSVNALDETFELVPGEQIAPGQGKIVDVAGEPPDGGAIQSETFSFKPGDTFELEFKLFAWQDSFFGEEASMRITFGSLFDEVFTIRFDDPLQTFTRTFEANFLGEAALIFDPRNLGNPRVDVAPFIDDVIFEVNRVPEPSSIGSLGFLTVLVFLQGKPFKRKKSELTY